jgi:hypothetical protein
MNDKIMFYDHDDEVSQVISVINYRINEARANKGQPVTLETLEKFLKNFEENNYSYLNQNDFNLLVTILLQYIPDAVKLNS